MSRGERASLPQPVSSRIAPSRKISYAFYNMMTSDAANGLINNATDGNVFRNERNVIHDHDKKLSTSYSVHEPAALELTGANTEEDTEEESEISAEVEPAEEDREEYETEIQKKREEGAET